MTLRRLYFVLSANLAAQLLLLPEKCTCYLIDPRIQPQRNGRRGETVRWLWSSSSSSPAENEHNEVSQKKRNRPAYTRSPDYPSFAYDDEISGANGRRPTRRVSIDSARKEEIYGGDETSKALFGMLTPPSSALEFDFLVSGIRDSNRRTRLLNRRSYTAREPFLQKNINEVGRHEISKGTHTCLVWSSKCADSQKHDGVVSFSLLNCLALSFSWV
mmetsp:Transcript_22367/g.62275  ORF Transcript_22367/g.62275 Transcript_22367/m.62275 type:complete len:216 (+) Transcript_22367:130-777(+)